MLMRCVISRMGHHGAYEPSKTRRYHETTTFKDAAFADSTDTLTATATRRYLRATIVTKMTQRQMIC